MADTHQPEAPRIPSETSGDVRLAFKSYAALNAMLAALKAPRLPLILLTI